MLVCQKILGFCRHNYELEKNSINVWAIFFQALLSVLILKKKHFKGKG
jgi:hypothetical protein